MTAAAGAAIRFGGVRGGRDDSAAVGVVVGRQVRRLSPQQVGKGESGKFLVIGAIAHFVGVGDGSGIRTSSRLVLLVAFEERGHGALYRESRFSLGTLVSHQQGRDRCFAPTSLLI